MKIVADENIPFITQYISPHHELILQPGRTLRREDLLDADMVLVRSVTEVNADLLDGTAVNYVGSATSGQDHMDTAWLEHAGIRWYVAEGCNTTAVVEYVIAVLAALQKNAIFPERKLRAGVIGHGRIGSGVVGVLEKLGFDVICYDPFLAQQDSTFQSTALADFAELDFISVHTPLTHDGQYPTYHMIDKHFLKRQRKGCVLLNAGRGAVVDFSDLVEYGQHLYWCFDVWEHEPHISFDVLGLCEIATPHIAGYSLQGRQRGIEMLYDQFSAEGILAPLETMPIYAYKSLTLDTSAVKWFDVVLDIFNPECGTRVMKNALIENNSEKTFDLLRKNFPERYEFRYVNLQGGQLLDKDRALLQALGIKM